MPRGARLEGAPAFRRRCAAADARFGVGQAAQIDIRHPVAVFSLATFLLGLYNAAERVQQVAAKRVSSACASRACGEARDRGLYRTRCVAALLRAKRHPLRHASR